MQIDITPCDSILETWTNEEIAAFNEFILERPDLFDKSINICDQAFVIEFEGFFELAQKDTYGTNRISDFIPQGLRGKDQIGYTEFGISLNLAYKFK